MDELIKIATCILAQHWRDPSTNMSLDRQRMLASHVVPVIAAQALRDAADAIDINGGEISMPVGLIAVALHARADRIEREDA